MLQNLEVGTLKAKRVIIESGNKEHVLELSGTENGVGLRIEHTESESLIVVSSEGEMLKIGIYAEGPCGDEEPDISILSLDGVTSLGVRNDDGDVVELTQSDLLKIASVVHREEEEEQDVWESELRHESGISVKLCLPSNLSLADLGAIQDGVHGVLNAYSL